MKKVFSREVYRAYSYMCAQSSANRYEYSTQTAERGGFICIANTMLENSKQRTNYALVFILSLKKRWLANSAETLGDFEYFRNRPKVPHQVAAQIARINQ